MQHDGDRSNSAPSSSDTKHNPGWTTGPHQPVYTQHHEGRPQPYYGEHYYLPSTMTYVTHRSNALSQRHLDSSHAAAPFDTLDLAYSDNVPVDCGQDSLCSSFTYDSTYGSGASDTSSVSRAEALKCSPTMAKMDCRNIHSSRSYKSVASPKVWCPACFDVEYKTGNLRKHYESSCSSTATVTYTCPYTNCGYVHRCYQKTAEDVVVLRIKEHWTEKGNHGPWYDDIATLVLQTRYVPNLWACSICARTFRSRNVFLDHLCDHTPKKAKLVADVNVPSSNGGVRYVTTKEWLQQYTDLAFSRQINAYIESQPRVAREWLPMISRLRHGDFKRPHWPCSAEIKHLKKIIQGPLDTKYIVSTLSRLLGLAAGWSDTSVALSLASYSAAGHATDGRSTYPERQHNPDTAETKQEVKTEHTGPAALTRGSSCPNHSEGPTDFRQGRAEGIAHAGEGNVYLTGPSWSDPWNVSYSDERASTWASNGAVYASFGLSTSNDSITVEGLHSHPAGFPYTDWINRTPLLASASGPVTQWPLSDASATDRAFDPLAEGCTRFDQDPNVLCTDFTGYDTQPSTPFLIGHDSNTPQAEITSQTQVVADSSPRKRRVSEKSPNQKRPRISHFHPIERTT